MDQRSWQGTMAIVKMYLPYLAHRSQLKRTMIVNVKKNDEVRLTETMSDFKDDELLEEAFDTSAEKTSTKKLGKGNDIGDSLSRS